MTDEDLTGAGQARERARRLLARAAERRVSAEPLARSEGVPDDRGPLITRAEAMARAQQLREAMAREPAGPAPDTAGPLERIGGAASGLGAGLHDLLRDLAAYLGDRPSKDHEAMALYGRVMRMLGTSENV